MKRYFTVKRMTKDELKAKRLEINNRMRVEQRALEKEFALANNKTNIGDLVSDHIGTVKVEEILIAFGDVPQCVYRGTEYTRARKPFKRGKRRDVYQGNLGK